MTIPLYYAGWVVSLAFSLGMVLGHLVTLREFKRAFQEGKR